MSELTQQNAQIQQTPTEVSYKKSVLENTSDLFVTIIGGIIIIAFIWGLAKGWYKTLKNYSKLADRGNLFFDKIIPGMLDHLCKTDRAPENLFVDWTKGISESTRTASPREITDHGHKLLKRSGLDKIFETNKEEWAKKIKDNYNTTASKLRVENDCFSLIFKLYESKNKAFRPLDEFLYEHPNDITSADIYGLLAISLRDFIFKKYPGIIKKASE